MALIETPSLDVGMSAPAFDLADPAGRRFTLEDVRGPGGLVVMFICNHCPYVQAVVDRTVVDMNELHERGIGAVAIMPNDYRAYPDDAPEAMAAFAERHKFGFPYLVDEDQSVARAYDAVCTPDFFGFDADLTLRYRGRLDEGRAGAARPDAPRELFNAMQDVAENRAAPAVQHPSMGCSIKWREA